MSETLNCTVRSCLYPREPFSGSTQWIKATTNVGTICGRLPFYPQNGMKLRLEGRWDAWHGMRRFEFTRAVHEPPKDGIELLKYVATMADGVGPKAVEKIYESYGDGWTDHVDELPPKWAIPLRRAYDSVLANAELANVLRLMLSHGGSPRIAELAVHKWGKNAGATIEANPYALAELDGIGFKTADAIAEKFGVGKRDMRRGLAAVDYAVSEAMSSSGDSVVGRDAVYEIIEGLDVPREIASLAVAKLSASGRIVFVGENHVTTNTVERNEGEIGRYIVESTGNSDRSYAPVGSVNGMKLTDKQVESVRNSVNNLGVTVINGGAGTGKTTTIQALCETLQYYGERFEVCAFAGKAASRIREATGFNASTIHSLLGYTGEGGKFKLGMLDGYTVIVDESSMVPSALLYEICKRRPKRLILVGDEAQLPPVGIGSPFHDIIANLPQLCVRLDVCHRASGAILAAGEEIRNGVTPKSQTKGGEKFHVERVRDAAAIEDTILDAVRSGKVDFRQDCVITPRSGDGESPMPCTVKSFNQRIQAIVNPHENGEKFAIGDRVMCVKNYPKDDVWNGTTGWITRVDIDGCPFFESDETGDETRLTKEMQKNFVPAWAVTIHKSQGSQYRAVYVACLKRDTPRLFDRAMLYTAVTRAKKECTIYCDDGLDRAVNAVHRRDTYLQIAMGEKK